MSFFRRSLVFLIAVGCTAPGAQVFAMDDVPDRIETLQPSTPWNIDFGEDRCRLARVFGEGDNEHLVFFEQAAPDSGFGMTLAGPRLRQFRNIITRLILRPDDGFPRVESRRGSVEGFGAAEIFSRLTIPRARNNRGAHTSRPPGGLRGLPQIDLVEAAKVKRIVFGHGGFGLSFETGDMAPPFQALNACSADFVRAWGLDAEKHESFRQMAQWTNEEEVARRIAQNYTSAAVSRGEQAILRMRVIVEADGTVSDCHLQEATEIERIRSNACEEMERAEFRPALDAEGQPMRSFYTTNIVYQIGGHDAHGGVRY